MNPQLIAVVLFAGGGGVEAGLLEAGVKSVIAVEFDPTKPQLSEEIADCHKLNFPGCRVVRQTVQEVATTEFPDFPIEPNILWASPVCSNFSKAKNGGSEQPEDIEAAKAVCQAIKQLRPQHFLLENVPKYADSDSWLVIENCLYQQGYQAQHSVEDLSNYGVPQARKRLIVRASRVGEPIQLPAHQPKISWYEAIADLIPGLPDSELVPGQKKAVEEWLTHNQPEPLLVKRTGNGAYRVIPSDRPSFVIERSIFSDQKGANRSKFSDIWLPGGCIKQVTIECVRRFQGFPAWYQLPESIAVAGSILGYSVPPKFVELMLKQAMASKKKSEGKSAPPTTEHDFRGSSINEQNIIHQVGGKMIQDVVSCIDAVDAEIAELGKRLEAKQQKRKQLIELDNLRCDTLAMLKEVICGIKQYSPDAIAHLKSAVLQLFNDGGNEEENLAALDKEDEEQTGFFVAVGEPPKDDPTGDEWVLSSDTPLTGQTCVIDPDIHWEATPPDGSSYELASPLACLLQEDAPDMDCAELTQHPENVAIAYQQRNHDGEIVSCYIGFNAKARASSWQSFVETMTDQVKLRPATRMSGFKYELKIKNLSMTQIDRLASEVDTRKNYRKSWDSEVKPPTYKESEQPQPVDCAEIEPGDTVRPLLSPSDFYEVIQVLPNGILDCKSLQTGVRMGLRATAVALERKKELLPPCPFAEGEIVEWHGSKLRVLGVGVETLHCVLPDDPEEMPAHIRVPIGECFAITTETFNPRFQVGDIVNWRTLKLLVGELLDNGKTLHCNLLSDPVGRPPYNKVPAADCVLVEREPEEGILPGEQSSAKVLLSFEETKWHGQVFPVVAVSQDNFGYSLETPEGVMWFRADGVQILDAEIEQKASPTEPIEEPVYS